LFLLLLAQFFISLALETRLLLCRLLNRLKEALEAALLCRLHVLLQLGRSIAHAVFVEVLVLDKELDQALDIGRLPLEVAFWGVGGLHVGLEEEKAGVGERPVVGQDELLLVVLDVLDYAFEVFVVADELEGG
jgi:hypothetical protein